MSSGGVRVDSDPEFGDDDNTRIPKGQAGEASMWAKVAAAIGVLIVILLIVVIVLVSDGNYVKVDSGDEGVSEAVVPETAEAMANECIFKSQEIPCYRWQGKDLVVEYDMNFLQTYDHEGNDMGVQPLTKFGSTHEAAMAPNGDLIITHMSTNSFTIVKGVKQKLGTTLSDDSIDHFSMERRLLEDSTSGLHSTMFSKKDPNIMFMTLELIDTIALYDYTQKKIIKKFEIPHASWGMRAAAGSTHVTTAHTFVEDKHGNIYFTMKKCVYDLDDDTEGMGAIGRLNDPLDDSIPDNERWMHWKMSKYGTGVKTLPFYINIDVKGEYVWFNSIISAEMGVIDSRDNDEPTIKMFTMPPPHNDGAQSSRGDGDLHNPRPGGMIVTAAGDCIVAAYNRYGSIAKINKNTGEVTYVTVPAVHGHDYAYLHISADFETYEDKTLYQGGKFDVVLTASSNDFKADTIKDDLDQDWSQPDQADAIMLMKGFDADAMTWKSMEEYMAPTQHSWFHRSWVLADHANGPELIVSTEYYADRLFFVWVNAAADADH